MTDFYKIIKEKDDLKQLTNIGKLSSFPYRRLTFDNSHYILLNKRVVKVDYFSHLEDSVPELRPDMDEVILRRHGGIMQALNFDQNKNQML